MRGGFVGRSNPFSTRFIRPGAIPFQFVADGLPGGEIEGGSELSNDNGPKDGLDPTFAGMVDRLQRAGSGVIVGPHGTGKSTLLSSLQPLLSVRYPRTVTVQLHAPESGRRWRQFQNAAANASRVFGTASQLPAGSLLVVDGIEQLSWWDRWRLRWYARRNRFHMLATSHMPLFGFSTLYVTSASRPLVEYLCHGLLADADDRTVCVVHRRLRELVIMEQTDIRSLLFDLYDVIAEDAAGASPRGM